MVIVVGKVTQNNSEAKQTLTGGTNTIIHLRITKNASHALHRRNLEVGSNLLSLGVFLYSRKAPYFGDCTAVPVKSTLEVNMVRHVVSALLLLTATSFSSTAQALAVNSPGTLSDHNSTVPLPIVVREAGIGGDNNDAITCIKRRFDGKYLVGGWTSSAAIEGLLPGMASARDGAAEDGFVALLSADLASVEYVHFISATKDERVTAIDILPNGKVCVVGQTNSTDFPVKGGEALRRAARQEDHLFHVAGHRFRP